MYLIACINSNSRFTLTKMTLSRLRSKEDNWQQFDQIKSLVTHVERVFVNREERFIYAGE